MSRVQAPSIAHMTDIHAFLLGLVQGITEFFPVSSSTHLYFVKKILGLDQTASMISFDLFCHLGTMAAACLFFRKEIFRIFSSLRTLALFSTALFPLIPAYFLFKPLRETLAGASPLFLILTSLILFLASSSRKEARPQEGKSSPKWRDVLCIGVAQSFALLPGVSRSGSTISVARLLGWPWEEAVRFSFLLAIPAIFGGTALEVLRFDEVQIPWRACGVGFAVSFLAGIGALQLLFRWLSPRLMRAFAWYCLTIGIISFLILK